MSSAGEVVAPAATPTREAPKNPKPKGRAGSIVAGIAAWIIGLLFVIPVVMMVLTSFHPESLASLNAPDLFAPLTLDNYSEFFGASSGQSPWPYLINSALASVVSTILVLALAIPAAYALSVKPVKKWTDVMSFFLSTKFLPAAAALAPLFLIAADIWVC